MYGSHRTPRLGRATLVACASFALLLAATQERDSWTPEKLSALPNDPSLHCDALNTAKVSRDDFILEPQTGSYSTNGSRAPKIVEYVWSDNAEPALNTLKLSDSTVVKLGNLATGEHKIKVTLVSDANTIKPCPEVVLSVK